MLNSQVVLELSAIGVYFRETSPVAAPQSITSFFRSGISSTDQLLLQQVSFLNVYSLMGFITLLVFGVVHLTNDSGSDIGYFELVGSVLMAANVILLRISKNPHLSQSVLLVLILAFLLLMLLTGGLQNTGILWFFVFPPAAFFLAGKVDGTLWVSLLFILITFIGLLSLGGYVAIPYEPIYLRQLLVSLFVVSTSIYVYQQGRERAEAARSLVEHAKSEFVTLASHQLRTPISAISWFGEMLLGGDAGKLSKMQREFIEKMYKSNQRSAAMVDAMLLVSTLELGTLAVRPEPAHLGQICHGLVKKFHKQFASAKKITVNESYQEMPAIKLDQHLAHTIIGNLISNAFKYTPDGGSVTVDVRSSAEKSDTASRGSAIISVTDTGFGIPKDQQELVFAKMFRAHNVVDKDTDGTGLGLYVVEKLLELVGGKVSFSSEEGRGSSFVIQLPLEGMPALGKSQDSPSPVMAGT